MTNTKRLAYAIYDIMQADAWSTPKEIAASFIGREFIYDICHEHERNGRCRSWTEYGFTQTRTQSQRRWLKFPPLPIRSHATSTHGHERQRRTLTQ